MLKLDTTLESFFQNLQNKALDHSAQILYCDFLCCWAYEQIPEFHRGSTHDIAFITFAFDFFEICARRKAQERRRNNNNFRSLQRVMKISDDECRRSSNGKGEHHFETFLILRNQGRISSSNNKFRA